MPTRCLASREGVVDASWSAGRSGDGYVESGGGV